MNYIHFKEIIFKHTHNFRVINRCLKKNNVFREEKPFILLFQIKVVIFLIHERNLNVLNFVLIFAFSLQLLHINPSINIHTRVQGNIDVNVFVKTH